MTDLILQFLFQHGANVNQTNQRGNTPLHEAARYNFQDLVEILIKIGHANPLSRNKAQLTPIQLAQVSCEKFFQVDLYTRYEVIFFIIDGRA